VNREDIKKYFQMLGQELQKREVTGEILVTADGVLMLLDIGKPEVSRDIDAYFSGHGTAIREAIADIADREGLTGNWLNDALKELFSTQPSQQKWAEYPGLRVYLAPLDFVLAIKVAAAGCPQDTEDIKTLAGKLQISNTQDMLTLIIKYIPEQFLTPEMRLMAEQAFKS